MARLTRAGGRGPWPDTLFGRLALLLAIAVLASHALALGMLFEMRPPPPPHPAAAGALPERVEPPPGARRPASHGMHAVALLDIGVRLAILLLAAWLAARWLSAPMRQLALAARAVGSDDRHPPLAPHGPRECRETTEAFNQMQARIRLQLAQRDQFVAAVSHDLRTPLTRLALRVQSLAQADERALFARDIAEMERMIGVTLDYLRGATGPEPWVVFDVASLLETIADDAQAIGQPVRFAGMPADAALTRWRTQPTALQRCLSNLVENAVRYAGGATLSLHVTAQHVVIEVADQGPGIAEHELAQVRLPFYRIEGSRNRDNGGVGLGLAIADDIARRLNGRLELRNAQPHGLIASVHLPR